MRIAGKPSDRIRVTAKIPMAKASQKFLVLGESWVVKRQVEGALFSLRHN